MTGSSQPMPVFKDRSLGLVVFGGVAILLGGVCALAVPLILLAAVFSGSAGGVAVSPLSALSSSIMYSVMAATFVVLGIGSIRARRWACELLLSLSWIWLLTGICTLMVGLLVIPGVLGELDADGVLPPELVVLVVGVIAGVVGVLYVVLPGLFVLFYRSPEVAATCHARDPRPQWVDACPRRLLTLMVVWALLAISVLLMPAYNFLFPLFGAALTGAAGAVGWLLVLAGCAALAVGTALRAPWAWSGGMLLTLVGGLSSTLTILRHGVGGLVERLGLPEEQAAMMASFGLLEGWPMVLINGLVWGTFVVYLWTLRGSFYGEPSDADR